MVILLMLLLICFEVRLLVWEEANSEWATQKLYSKKSMKLLLKDLKLSISIFSLQLQGLKKRGVVKMLASNITELDQNTFLLIEWACELRRPAGLGQIPTAMKSFWSRGCWCQSKHSHRKSPCGSQLVWGKQGAHRRAEQAHGRRQRGF
jgi:hypothetical protein